MDYGHPTTLSSLGIVVCMKHPGGLHRVIINFPGTAGNLLTLYDSASTASGPVLAVIDATATVPTRHFDVQVQNGVVASLDNGTPGNVTIVTD